MMRGDVIPRKRVSLYAIRYGISFFSFFFFFFFFFFFLHIRYSLRIYQGGRGNGGEVYRVYLYGDNVIYFFSYPFNRSCMQYIYFL